MSSAPRSPRIAVIVTTIGRPRLLDRLLLSLAGQSLPPAEVLVVDQSEDEGTATVVEHRADRLPIRRIVSPRGASAGRNAGLVELGILDAATIARPSGLGVLDAMLAARPVREMASTAPGPRLEDLPLGFDIVLFPDDDTWYQPDALERAVRGLIPPADVVSGRMLASDGRPAQLSFAEEPGRIDARTVWTQALTETCFFRTGFLRAVGGFDEGLGIGCGTPWQSGAETDLLLRGLRAGRTIMYDPDIRVFEHNPDDPDSTCREHRAKARHAARGTGRVYQRYYTAYACARVVVRPLGGAVLALGRGRFAEAAWYLQKAIGRAEGITGALLPAPPPHGPQR